METPWQIGWVAGRLAPRWIVEHLSGKRPARVRIAFVEATDEEVERVRNQVLHELGGAWRVQAIRISARDPSPPSREPADLVWALSGLRRQRWEERLRLASTLGAWLAPGGYLIADPSEVTAWGAALAPCSAPGIFVKVETAQWDSGAPG